MPRRFSISLVCLVCCAFPLFAQLREDYPALYKSKAPTKEETARRDALHHYLLGILCEREDRLIEALKAYEKSGDLDPSAAAFKSQVAILLVLERPQDALALAKKVFELDPADFDIAFVLARLQKVQGNVKEALQVLEKCAAHPSLKDTPTVAQQIYTDLGSLHEMADDFAKAAIAFNKAAEILDHPDLLLDDGPFHRNMILAKAAETYERIGQLHRKAKQYDQALAAFKKAQTRLPEGANRLHWNLAQVANEQGQHDVSLKHLDEYLRLQPLVIDPYHLKIDLLTRLKRPAEILPWLENATQLDRHNASLRLLLAKEYQKAGKAREAEKTFKTLADDSPSPESYRGLLHLWRDDASRGMVHVLFQVNKTISEAAKKPSPPGALGQAKGMIGALREDGVLAKDLVDIAFRLPDKEELNLETLHLLAALADKHRKNDEAEQFYRKSLKATAPGLEHLVYGGLLRTLWKGRKFEAIVEVCKEGIKKAEATNHILFYNDMAKAYARLHKYKEALTQIDRAVDLAGDQHVLVVRLTRIRILAQAERYDEAEKECHDMLKQFSQPGDVLEVRYLLSSIYSGKKQLTKAEEQLELVLKMDPANATANNDLGYIWADQNKHLDKAEEMVRRALDLDRRQRKLGRESMDEEDQDNAAYVDSLGWVLFRQGRLLEARKELERAVSLPGGEDPTLWDHLGDVYHRLEMYGEAQRAWETSNRLFEKEDHKKPDERHQEVQRKLKKVGKLVGAK